MQRQLAPITVDNAGFYTLMEDVKDTHPVWVAGDRLNSSDAIVEGYEMALSSRLVKEIERWTMYNQNAFDFNHTRTLRLDASGVVARGIEHFLKETYLQGTHADIAEQVLQQMLSLDAFKKDEPISLMKTKIGRASCRERV